MFYFIYDILELNVFKNIFANWWFSGIQVFIIFLQFILVQFLGDFARTVPLSFVQWCFCILFGALSLPTGKDTDFVIVFLILMNFFK